MVETVKHTPLHPDVEEIRAQAIEDVLSALTAHELYRYRPKAFEGFISYAREKLIYEDEAKAWRTDTAGWQPISTMPREDGLVVEVRQEKIETWNAMRFLRHHGDEGWSWRAARSSTLSGE